LNSLKSNAFGAEMVLESQTAALHDVAMRKLIRMPNSQIDCGVTEQRSLL